MDKSPRTCLLNMDANDIDRSKTVGNPASPGRSSYSKLQKSKSLENQWDLGYYEDPGCFLTDSEKMLRAEKDRRVANILRVDEEKRSRRQRKEFKRLEERESEDLRKVESDRILRESPRNRTNLSSVGYNIVTREVVGSCGAELIKYEESLAGWRKAMRALYLQSKQSRAHNVISWQPSKPCILAPEKPERPPAPEPGPTRRKPPLVARPRNILHSMDKCEDVPVRPTNDFMSNF